MQITFISYISIKYNHTFSSISSCSSSTALYPDDLRCFLVRGDINPRVVLLTEVGSGRAWSSSSTDRPSVSAILVIIASVSISGGLGGRGRGEERFGGGRTGTGRMKLAASWWSFTDVAALRGLDFLRFFLCDSFSFFRRQHRIHTAYKHTHSQISSLCIYHHLKPRKMPSLRRRSKVGAVHPPTAMSSDRRSL